jgi:hypothetical protein
MTKDKQAVKSNISENDWRAELLQELKDQDVIAIESLRILTEKDIRTALKAMKEVESERDEAEELKYIKELQQQRAARMSGS